MTGVLPVAITGIGCRVPGASNLESLWDSFVSFRDPFRVLPNARFDPEIFASELPDREGRPMLGALVQDFALDWRMLRLPPAQVEHLHRVERLALAAMGDALANADIQTGTQTLDKGCIWMAASTLGPDPWLDPMARIRRHELVAPLRETLDAQLRDRAAELGALLDRVSDLAAPPLEPDVLMISAAIIAGRASHLYDFRGGHLAIDAGMCSSLAAVSQAVRALQREDCDLALVCAAAPLITPSAVLAYAHRSELARERPRPFATDSTGTLLGEGAVAVVLQRVDDAKPKRTYAVIEAVQTYSTGDSDPESLTDCVALAARRALDQAGIAAHEVTMIESRAGGIRDADRAEAAGLAKIYRDPTSNDKAQTLLTSSVPCLGFLQAASGLVALAKAALALQHQCWPGQAGSSGMDAAEPGLTVPASATHWTTPRRAAVSDAGPESIAYHAILATAPSPQSTHRPVHRTARSEPIAVVGIGVVAPGAANVEQFWANTLARREFVGSLPRSRWDADRLIGSSTEFSRAFNPRLAGAVDIPKLDPCRYRIPAELVKALDPAAALALDAVEQALGDSGNAQSKVAAGRVNLVLGQVSLRVGELAAEKRVQYALLVALACEVLREAGIGEREISAIATETRARFDEENDRFGPHTLDAFSSLTPARLIATALGVSGEVLSLDAACASSLAAVGIGSESLCTGEADLAIAGGVSFHLVPEYYVALGLLDALSTRGGHPFHRSADGFVPAEAAGAVVLKRLADARRDGDRVYAVIKGHGVSSDGRGLSIYSANPIGQQLAMSRAFSAAGIRPTDVDLIEAHGPGAPLGDRAEITSIAAIYGERPFLPTLCIASAKSLVGHASSAGAMLSLIRASLALASKVLPPSGGDGDLSPDMPFGATLELSRVTRAWITSVAHPRRAAVNAFGMTGINHHVLLEEASADPSRSDLAKTALERPVARPPRPLSAHRFTLSERPVSLPSRAPAYPLSGRRLLLICDRGKLWSDLQELLLTRGARPLRLELEACKSETRISALLADTIVDGVIDLSGFEPNDAPAVSTLSDFCLGLKSRADSTYSIVRSVYERFANAAAATCCYVAVTSTGSLRAPNPSQHACLAGAFSQGFARALKQELPNLLCKAIDIDPGSPLQRTAQQIVQEIEDGNDRVDVRYASRRFVTQLERSDHDDTTPALRKLMPGDVFVFSGGGRGVVYQCAAALARRGVNVVVTGRRALPDASLPWTRMTDEEFSAFRRAELVRRRTDEGPARVVKSLADMELQRQVFANLRDAQAAGLPLHYEICDITDFDSVATMTHAVRSRFGRIDGVGHGAMIEQSALIPRKSSQTIDATLATKVNGLMNLLSATDRDPLKWFVAFGSGVGRYGNSGQTDYAAANAAVSALLRLHRSRSSRATQFVTMDWPAWEALGATANRDIADLLRAAGVTSISLEEGIYWFLSELTQGDTDEVVICGERMLQAWPYLAQDADGRAERALEADDDGRMLLASRWPMLDRVVEASSSQMVAERVFSVDRDLYMPEHRLNGVPVLPATFSCELLAEAARVLCPGSYVHEITDFRVDAPFSLPHDHPHAAKITARTASEADRRTIACEVRSSLQAKLTNSLPPERLHHSASVILSSAPPPPLGTLRLPRRTEILHANSFYRALSDPVKLGRLFGQAHFIQVFGNEALGVIQPPELGAMFLELSEPCFVASPLLIDAALQVAGSWDGYVNGFVSVPLGIETMKLGRPAKPSEHTTAFAHVIAIQHPDVYYDLEIVGSESEVLVRIHNLHLKRIGSPTRPE